MKLSSGLGARKTNSCTLTAHRTIFNGKRTLYSSIDIRQRQPSKANDADCLIITCNTRPAVFVRASEQDNQPNPYPCPCQAAPAALRATKAAGQVSFQGGGML